MPVHLVSTVLGSTTAWLDIVGAVAIVLGVAVLLVVDAPRRVSRSISRRLRRRRERPTPGPPTPSP